MGDSGKAHSETVKAFLPIALVNLLTVMSIKIFLLYILHICVAKFIL